MGWTQRGRLAAGHCDRVPMAPSRRVWASSVPQEYGFLLLTLSRLRGHGLALPWGHLTADKGESPAADSG